MCNHANMVVFMDQQQIIAEFERRAKIAGISIGDVCRQAKVHPTTFSRWKLTDKNATPVGANLTSLSAIDAALAGFEQGRAA